jgi:hypothetical protein
MCYKTVLCMKFMYRGMRAKQNVWDLQQMCERWEV